MLTQTRKELMSERISATCMLMGLMFESRETGVLGSQSQTMAMSWQTGNLSILRDIAIGALCGFV